MLYGRYLYQIDKSRCKHRNLKEVMHRAIATNSPAPTYVAGKDLPQPSDLACRFAQALLQRDPDSRPSASQCLQLEAVATVALTTEAKTSCKASSVASAVRLAKQMTNEFKTAVDPTVAKSMDELIMQLQRRHQ